MAMLRRLYPLIFLGLLLPACAGAPRRGPYLQSVTPTSIWVVWDTAEAGLGLVEDGLTEQLGQVIEETRPTTHHEVQLSGLQPYTQYCYRLPGGRTNSFRTAASPEQASFRFAALGDTQEGGLTHGRLVRRITQAMPDFVLHTGDLVDFGKYDPAWDDFFRVEAPLLRTAPLYPSLGNHEEEAAEYFDAFLLPGEERWYSFDYGNARFISLKADGYGAEQYFPDRTQLAWLEAELAANDRPWLFVFFHIAPFTSRDEGILELGMRLRLVPLFERYGVDAVFTGHNHGYERLLVNGITYLTTAGGGAPFYEHGAPEPGSQVVKPAHHYLLVEVSGDQLSAQAIDPGGEIIDRFVLTGGK